MLEFLADAGFLCDKAAMLRDTIKCTSCLRYVFQDTITTILYSAELTSIMATCENLS